MNLEVYICEIISMKMVGVAYWAAHVHESISTKFFKKHRENLPEEYKHYNTQEEGGQLQVYWNGEGYYSLIVGSRLLSQRGGSC